MPNGVGAHFHPDGWSEAQAGEFRFRRRGLADVARTSEGFLRSMRLISSFPATGVVSPVHSFVGWSMRPIPETWRPASTRGVDTFAVGCSTARPSLGAVCVGFPGRRRGRLSGCSSRRTTTVDRPRGRFSRTWPSDLRRRAVSRYPLPIKTSYCLGEGEDGRAQFAATRPAERRRLPMEI